MLRFLCNSLEDRWNEITRKNKEVNLDSVHPPSHISFLKCMSCSRLLLRKKCILEWLADFKFKGMISFFKQDISWWNTMTSTSHLQNDFIRISLENDIPSLNKYTKILFILPLNMCQQSYFVSFTVSWQVGKQFTNSIQVKKCIIESGE